MTDVAPEESGGDALEVLDVLELAETVDTAGQPQPISGKWVQLSNAQLGEHVLKSVWGFPDGNVIAVGEAGLVAAKVQDAFSVAYQDPSLNILNGVWGSSPQDIWTVGMYGLIYHYDGESWSMPKYCATVEDCSFAGQCLLAQCESNECHYTPTGFAGCCGSQHFETHFDSAADSNLFTIEDLYVGTTDGGVLWQVAGVTAKGEQRAKTPPNTLYFGNPFKPCAQDAGLNCPDFNNGKTVGATATSPVVDIPATAEQATLLFQLYIDVEASPAADKFAVRVLNSGKWEEAWSKTSLSGNYPKQFIPVKVDLSKYVGKSVRFQFYFDSVNPSNNALEGIYVDDVLLTSTCSVAGALAGKFPTLWAVWGASSKDVFAVGSEGTILHYDGTSWQKQAGGEVYDFLCVHGASATDVVLGGKGSVMLHYKGEGWTQDMSPGGGDITRVWGTSPERYVAIGPNGALLVFQNGQWSQGSGSYTNVNGVIGFADDDYYVVGDLGTLLHYDGNAAAAFAQVPIPGIGSDLFAIWGEDPSFITVVGDKLVASGPPSTLSVEIVPVQTTWTAVWGADGQRFVGGAFGKVMVWDGSKWTNMVTPSESTVLDLWGFSPKDVWAVGAAGLVMHYAGSKWEAVKVPGQSEEITYTDVWGSAADDVYVVAVTEDMGSYLLHFDGKSWKVALSGTVANLRHVYGLSGTDLYAVGQWGTIVHYDGKGWGVQPIDPYEMEGGNKYYIQELLMGVHARAADDVFAVGETGVIVHYDGQAWTLHNLVEKSLRSVYALDPVNVWAVGVAGYIVHFTGAGWVAEPSGTVATLYDVWGDGKGTLFAVGDSGTVLRFVPDE